MADLWSVLGIEETKNKDTLKNAYRMKLVCVNPEDDPEGFKSLREAYERAINLADTADTEDDDYEGAPEMAAFEKAFDALYGQFSRRINAGCWQELLDTDFCVSLETAGDAREFLLQLLNGRLKLPRPVWQMIDSKMQLKEDRKELYEQFPRDYIDYIIRLTQVDAFLPYSSFSGPDDADYDLYIDGYYELKLAVDEKRIDNGLKQYQKLEDMPVTHPYAQAEYARLLALEGKTAEAAALLARISEENPDYSYIHCHYGRLLLVVEDIDGAEAVFKRVLKTMPDYYMAKAGLMDVMIGRRDYKNAKEEALELLELEPRDMDTIDKLKQVNTHLIQGYMELLSIQPEDQSAILELGWCLCQNERYQECDQLLTGQTFDEAHTYDFINLRGRIYLCLEQYVKALEYLLPWRQMIIDLEDDGSTEYYKRKRRLGYAGYAIASSYLSLAEDGKSEYYEKALEYIQYALQDEKEPRQLISCQYIRAEIYHNMGKYEDCVESLDELIAEERGFYPGYVLRLKAYVAMGRAQKAIEDYYQAVKIYAGHVQPYEIAAKIFLDYNDYEQLETLLNKAEEAGIMNDELEYARIRLRREKAETVGEVQDVLEYCRGLMKDDLETPKKARLWKQIALCLHDIEKYKEALEAINQAIEKDLSDDSLRSVKAAILEKLKQYSEAMALYQDLSREYSGSPYYLFQIGRIEGDNGSFKSAISYYKKVIELDDKYPLVYRNLGLAHKELAQEQEETGHYHEAITYFERQIGLSEMAYDLIERSRIYLQLEDYDAAIRDARRAIEIDPENIYASNTLGDIYRYQNLNEQAIEAYQEAINREGQKETPVILENIGHCYESLGRFREAAEAFEKNVKLYSKRPRSYISYGNVLIHNKEYDKAIDQFELAMTNNNADKAYFRWKIGKVYMTRGDYPNAVKIYKKMLKDSPRSSLAYDGLGEYYLYVRARYAKAVKYYLKAYEIALANKDKDQMIEYAFELSYAYYMKADMKNAKYYIQKIMDMYVMSYALIKVGRIPEGLTALVYYKIGKVQAWLGNYTMAQEYFKKMASTKKCYYCGFSKCYDVFMGQGLVLRLTGDIKGALKCYQQALAVEPGDIECRGIVECLKKMI